MKLTSLKAIDSAMDELEAKEGLPDFIPLADEIGKALRKPPASVKRDSVEKRKRRLKAARQGHDTEVKTVRAKAENESRRLSPEGMEEHRKRCEELKKEIESALAAGDVKNAQISIDDLILDCPDDSEIPAFVGDLQAVSTAQADEADQNKAANLGQVSKLSAIPSKTGKPSISLSWMKGNAALADSFRIERLDMSSGETDELPPLFDTRMVDQDVKLGIPYRYVVTPCYRSIPGKQQSLSEIVVCTQPICDFHATKAEGTSTLGIVDLSWQRPGWDTAAKVETRLVRGDGRSWDVSGKDAFNDENVVAGETHTYSLEVTIGGKRLEPIECAVTVARVEEPPAVIGACVVMQGGLPRLSIPNWPDGVSEVVVIRPGQDPHPLSREDSFSFHTEDEAKSASICAVRRFGPGKADFGPSSGIAGVKRTHLLQVSICSFHSTVLDRLAFWKPMEYGMRIDVPTGCRIPALAVEIRGRDHTRSFVVEAGLISPGAIFPFPSKWGATRGDVVSISVSDPSEAAVFSVVYRTSKSIP